MKKKNSRTYGKEKAQKPGLLFLADKLYQKLPVLPLLDRQTSAIAYVCILFYFGFVAYMFFASPPPEIYTQLVEAPLVKNTGIMLLAGERYTYQVSLQGPQAQSQQVGYEIRKDASCSGLLVIENTPSTLSSVCLSSSGNAVSEELGYANSTFGNRSIMLFSPWMLAASENFSWRIETVVTSIGMEARFPVSYKSSGIREIAGRKAFEILVTPEYPQSGQPAKYYVDSEKRVLLFADFGNLTARLTSAPFALNWSNGIN
jgi:hypothetical protein